MKKSELSKWESGEKTKRDQDLISDFREGFKRAREESERVEGEWD